MSAQRAAELKDLVAGLCMVAEIDVVPKGHLRVQTGFLYPDGSSVDLFVVEDLMPPSQISDLGQTTAFLLDHDVMAWTSKKRKKQLEEAIGLYDVTMQGGALYRDIKPDKKSLQESIVLLGQACVRMSDLVYTKRLQLQSPFSDDVEEFMADTELDYDAGATLTGSFGPVSVDFLVSGKRTRSAVLTLASRLPGSGHTQANEVFRKWHDLNAASAPESRVTLLDDSVDINAVYKDEDLKRLQQYSTLHEFSDRTGLQTLLAA